jgi:hypothetical protein
MKRVGFYIIILTIASLMLSACSLLKTKEDPIINVQFTVSNLTEEEYDYAGTTRFENPTIDDFKNIEFTLEMKHSNKILNRTIIIPEFKTIANSNEINQYWFGNAYSQDNPTQNFAEYGYEFVFYSKGLDEEDIKEIFETGEVKITWNKEDGSYEEKIYNLGDIINFQ